MVSADVVILGAGPAGIALASQLTRQSLSVIVVDASNNDLSSLNWPNTYGVWRDDLRELGLGHVAHTPTSTTVVRTSDQWRRLNVEYTLIDNSRLRDTLIARADLGLLSMTSGKVVRLRETNDSTVAETDADQTIEGRVLFDCRGAVANSSSTFQIASGIIARLHQPYAPNNATVLMDWSGPDRANGSFCYAIPLPHVGPNIWLIEETVLSTRDTSQQLKDELYRRARRRIHDIVAQELGTEDVSIPLDGSADNVSLVGIGFGARSGYVNPISGYSLMTSLRRADSVAQATAEAIRLPQNIRLGSVAGVAWTDQDRRRRQIESAGARIITDIGQASAAQFFETFFALPTRRWFAFLRGQSTPRGMLATMAAMYKIAPPELRRQLRKTRP